MINPHKNTQFDYIRHSPSEGTIVEIVVDTVLSMKEVATTAATALSDCILNGIVSDVLAPKKSESFFVPKQDNISTKVLWNLEVKLSSAIKDGSMSNGVAEEIKEH